MKKIISIMLSVLFSSPLFAETIILKSGKIVERKIAERTNDYIKIDFYGVPLTYYYSDIESIDGKKINAASPQTSEIDKLIALPESQPLDLSLTETFTNKEWGYSFRYPSGWETIPKEERQEGMAMGFRPKEESVVTIEIQRDSFSDSDIEGKRNLRELVDSIFFASDNLKQEFIKPISLSSQEGYHIRNTFTKAVMIKNSNGTIVAKHFFDSYFVSPIFSSAKQDKRFFHIQLHYLLYENPEDIVKGFDFDRDITKDSMEKNKIIKMHLQEAKNIIDSFRILEQ